MAKQFKTMGGRRSRYWCGRGIFRETKKAPVRGFIGQWSAPTFCSAGGFGRRCSSGKRERNKGENEQRTKRREDKPKLPPTAELRPSSDFQSLAIPVAQASGGVP